MTRALFGGTTDDWLFGTVSGFGGALVSLNAVTVTGTCWDSQTNGTQYTDLLDANGSPITVLTVDGSVMPRFSGPDGVVEMWVDFGDGRYLLEARNQAAAAAASQSAAASSATSSASSATSAASSATAAAASAATAHDISNIDTSDGVVTALIGDSGSTTTGALNAAYVGYAPAPSAGNDTAALQALCNAAKAAGGGKVILKAGTYIVAGLVLGTGVRLIGQGSNATILRLPDGANGNVVQSDNLAALIGSNTWLVSGGVPVGMGVEHLRIDGNKAANTSGNGIRFYAKRYTVRDVITHDNAENGLLTECGNTGGQAVTDDVPECEIDQVWARSNGNHGIYFRGPHDGHVGSVYTMLNGANGFVNETVSGVVGGLLDVAFIHSYANAGDGVQMLAPASFTNLISESNGSRGVLIAPGVVRSRIGTAFVFNNNTASTANPSVELAGANTTIGSMTIRCDKGGVGFRNTAGSIYNTVGSLNIDGQGSAGVGIDIVGNHLVVGGAAIVNFSGAGGLGIQVASGAAQIAVTAVLQNNATQANYLGSPIRSLFDLSGYVAVGQTGVTGTLPSATSLTRYRHAFGGPGTVPAPNNMLSGHSWSSGHAIMGAYHLWVDAAGIMRIKNSPPASDYDGSPVQSSVSAGSAAFTSATATINVSGRYLGQQAYDTTTGRPVWSRGNTSTSIWVFADGTTAYTPA